MDDNRVRLTITPSGGDDGSIALSDFLKQVDALKRLVGLAANNVDIDMRVVGLEMNSPASIEIEAWQPSTSASVAISPFFHDVFNVVEKAATPQNLARDVFDAIKELASTVGKDINSALLTTSSEQIKIDITAKDRIESIFGKDYSRDGTADGMLEAVNIHGKVNNCALYPVTGPNRINCRFEEQLFKQVRPALGRYVLVEGSLRYRWREKFPYEANIARIEVLPRWEDQPSFDEILGMAPDATKGVISEDFVKASRNGW